MNLPPNERPALAAGSGSSDDLSALLAIARTLARTAKSGGPGTPLRGKNLGLLCEFDVDAEAALVRRAALELGAHVAHIRPSLTEMSTRDEVRHTARMLGRLYDVLVCQGLPPGLVQQIGAEAGVPVLDGAASATHPTAPLTAGLDGGVSPDDARRFVLQALLLRVLG